MSRPEGKPSEDSHLPGSGEGQGLSRGPEIRRVDHPFIGQEPIGGGVNKPELHPPQSPHSSGEQIPLETWHLSSDELQPDNLRNLGLIIYLFFMEEPDAMQLFFLYKEMEQRQQEELAQALQRRETEDSLDTDEGASVFGMMDIPAQAYLDWVARSTGIHAGLLRRWTGAVSRELAATCLPLVRKARDASGPVDRFVDDLLGRDLESPIEAVDRVARHGIGASVADHEELIRQAKYQRLPLPFTYKLLD